MDFIDDAVTKAKEAFVVACKKTTEVVAAIDEKNAKIDELRREINNIKNKRVCPKCGASIDKCSVYCNFCGEKLVFESAAGPDTEEKSEEE